MFKQSETDLSREVASILKVLENSKKIVWSDRIQCGEIPVLFGEKRHYMRLSREGTPDRYMILKSGEMVWLEIKTTKGEQSREQVAFMKMVSVLDKHYYRVIRSLDDLFRVLKDFEIVF